MPVMSDVKDTQADEVEPVALVKPGNHVDLKAGDMDPELNKIVKDLVLRTDYFIVYIATDRSIQ